MSDEDEDIVYKESTNIGGALDAWGYSLLVILFLILLALLSNSKHIRNKLEKRRKDSLVSVKEVAALSSKTKVYIIDVDGERIALFESSNSIQVNHLSKLK